MASVQSFAQSVAEAFTTSYPYLLAFLVLHSVGYFYLKRATAPFLASVDLASYAFFVAASPSPFLVALSAAPFIALKAYLKKKKGKLNFNKKVYSLSLVKNELVSSFKQEGKGVRVVGKIEPYFKKHLKYNGKKILMDPVVACGVTLISGSSGSGKTEHVKSLIKQDLETGYSVAFFEYKGDQKLVREVREYAESLGVEVYVLSTDYVDFNYDPLKYLNSTGRVEALLNTRKWSADGSDAHYRTSTQLLIQKLVSEFEESHDESVENYTLSFYEFVKRYNYDRASSDAYFTVLKILELILTSRLRSVWEGTNEKDFSFSLDKQFLVIFSFLSSNKELANSISSFAFKDLLDVGVSKGFATEYLALYVDEYGSLENSYLIKDLIEKGRSCNIQTTISLQDVNQVVINTNQAYLNSILGTINNFIIYAGATKHTAEILGGVQLYEIEDVLLNLRKPYKGKAPSAMYISKYPSINKDQSVDVFKITPYVKKSKFKEFKASTNPASAEQSRHADEEESSESVGSVTTSAVSKHTSQDVPDISPEVKDVNYDDFI